MSKIMLKMNLSVLKSDQCTTGIHKGGTEECKATVLFNKAVRIDDLKRVVYFT